MDKHLQPISKNLSHILRHRPDSVGLELADGGWVVVDDLLAALARTGNALARDLLDQVVADNDKQRFEFNADGTQIRARQGHSAEVDLGYEPAQPPATLYHGTAEHSLESILARGLNKGRRHDVHLSTNKETMIAVATRHGKPVVLAIDAARMARDGYEFFITGNNVWLTDHVPPQYISVATL